MNSTLFINGRFLTQQTTGVQSFARSVCTELEKVCDYKLVVPAKAILPDAAFNNRIIRTGNLQGHLWEQMHLPVFMSRQRGSVLLNLCNTAPAILKNQVVTVHDLAFMKDNNWFNPVFSKYYSLLVPLIAKRSKAVVTVSEAVKKEIADSLNVPENKIHVAGNKVQNSLLNTLSQAPKLKEIVSKKFFLMVGSRDPRKNFSMAELLFAEKFPEYNLVIAGGKANTFKNNNITESHPNCISLGYTNESELRWLYEHALALINPSLYEGFGIPNLEAFAFECPVLCSDLPVFREICGDAAGYFHPQQPETLFSQINNLLTNPSLTAEKTKLGKVIFTSIQQKDRSQILLKAIAL